jgi:hypothetical protein
MEYLHIRVCLPAFLPAGLSVCLSACRPVRLTSPFTALR